MAELPSELPSGDEAVSLDAAGLIDVWERAAGATPLLRAPMLLAAAWPGHDWLRVPIGQRDRYLFRLRAALFGDALDAMASCPSCAADLEVPLRTGDLLIPPTTGDPLTAPGHCDGARELRRGDTVVRYRLPTTLDLLSVADTDAGQRRDLLLRRCLLEGTADDPEIDLAIVAGMAESDPQADTSLALACPECGHAWSAPFDIAAYLWADLEACARRLLRQVHALAAAYGWSEREILGLSATRRRLYVDSVMGTA
jgi:hypothetical protein